MIKKELDNGTEVSIYEIYEKEFSQTYAKANKIFKKSLSGAYTNFIKNSRKDSICIPTGIASFDEVLNGGLRPGLYVLGSNPGIGKTSLILDMMMHLAELEQHSVFFNLEMSEQQVAAMLFSNLSFTLNAKNPDEVKATPIADFSCKTKIWGTGNYKEDVKVIVDEFHKKYDQYINVLTKAYDEKLAYVETIETTVKHYKEILNVTPVVFVDFLQMLTTEPKLKDEFDSTLNMYDKRLEVNEILEDLKVYSNKYQVPIVLITTISRSAYTKDTSESSEVDYNISFAKESGNIEYFADFLVLLTREKAKNKLGGVEQQLLVLNILKTRYNHDCGKVRLSFVPNYAHFSEYEQEK